MKTFLVTIILLFLILALTTTKASQNNDDDDSHNMLQSSPVGDSSRISAHVDTACEKSDYYNLVSEIPILQNIIASRNFGNVVNEEEAFAKYMLLRAAYCPPAEDYRDAGELSEYYSSDIKYEIFKKLIDIYAVPVLIDETAGRLKILFHRNMSMEKIKRFAARIKASPKIISHIDMTIYSSNNKKDQGIEVWKFLLGFAMDENIPFSIIVHRLTFVDLNQIFHSRQDNLLLHPSLQSFLLKSKSLKDTKKLYNLLSTRSKSLDCLTIEVSSFLECEQEIVSALNGNKEITTIFLNGDHKSLLNDISTATLFLQVFSQLRNLNKLYVAIPSISENVCESLLVANPNIFQLELYGKITEMISYIKLIANFPQITDLKLEFNNLFRENENWTDKDVDALNDLLPLQNIRNLTFQFKFCEDYAKNTGFKLNFYAKIIQICPNVRHITHDTNLTVFGSEFESQFADWCNEYLSDLHVLTLTCFFRMKRDKFVLEYLEKIVLPRTVRVLVIPYTNLYEIGDVDQFKTTVFSKFPQLTAVYLQNIAIYKRFE